MKSNRVLFHLALQVSAWVLFMLFFAGAAPQHISAITPSPQKTAMSTGGLVALIILAHITIIGLIPLMIVSLWKIFEKAGESGWKSLIPFYNIYVLWKISGAKSWAMIMALGSAIGSYITNFIANIFTLNSQPVPVPLSLVSGIFGIAGLIGDIVISLSLAESFGKGVGFAVGLILLPTIFYPILAFKDSDYNSKK